MIRLNLNDNCLSLGSLSVTVSLLEQLVRRREELRSSVDELQQVGPALVDGVFPLGHVGGLRVARFDQLVYRLVDQVHSLLSHRPRLPRKLSELVPQKLKVKDG